MNWFIFISVIFVFCFQEGQCCLKRRSTDDVCECPNFLELVDADRNNVLFTEDAGCERNATCGTHSYTYLKTRYNVSEITPPDDQREGFNVAFLETSANKQEWGDPVGPPVELFSFFGIICENSKWYATKYPVGIQYNTNDGLKYFGGGGELNGKKSEILEFTCRRAA